MRSSHLFSIRYRDHMYPREHALLALTPFSRSTLDASALVPSGIQELGNLPTHKIWLPVISVVGMSSQRQWRN